MDSPSRAQKWPRTLRELTVGLVVTMLVAALLLVVLSLWSSFALRSATEDVIRHNQSLSATRELERQLYLSHRLGNLYMVTDEAEVAETRDQVWRDLGGQVRRAESLAVSDEERRLLGVVAAGFATYAQEREALEARQDGELSFIIRETYRSLATAAKNLDELRVLDRTQVVLAEARVERIQRISEILPLAASLLIVALLIIAFTVIRREILEPIFALHRAVERFRGGDLSMRVEAAGMQEMWELSTAYNELTEVLQEQRTTQIEFLAQVAHDLRSPLSGIHLAAQTLAMGPVNERQERTVELLLRQVERLTRLVDDLGTATLSDAGRFEIVKENVSLEQVVEDVVEIYGPTSQKHSFNTQWETPGLTVAGDRSRLEQVISNLLSNAIKYSPEGGEIAIEGRTEEDRVVLSVTDPGIGIDPEVLPSIFEPFQRLQTSVAPGAGLGLTVVRQIVEAHDGEVRAHSVPGEGTTLEIVLPIATRSSEAAPAETLGGTLSGLRGA